jgi:hypothetical protein
MASSNRQLHITERKMFSSYKYIIKEFLFSLFLTNIFLYPADIFVALWGTYFVKKRPIGMYEREISTVVSEKLNIVSRSTAQC